MIRIRLQQREISKDLSDAMQERIREFRTEGVRTTRKVALLIGEKNEIKAAMVYGVHAIPLYMQSLHHHIRWVYVYEEKSWVFNDSATTRGQRLYRMQLLRGMHLEETLYEAKLAPTAVIVPYVRVALLNDRRPESKGASLWPPNIPQLVKLHNQALLRRVAQTATAVGKAPTAVAMAGMFHLVPIENGAFAASQTAAPLSAPVPDLVATTQEQQVKHIRSLSAPYKDATATREVSYLCFVLVINQVHAREYADRPIMFSAYVSLSAADEGRLRPIPSLYVPFKPRSSAWCVVPLKPRAPANARIHIDAYQEMNNAAGTRISHCKIAHAHFSVSALASESAFQEEFMHCVHHTKRMFSVHMRRDKDVAAALFGEAHTRIHVNKYTEAGDVVSVPPSKTRDATNDYIHTLHREIARCGGIAAKFPSGKLATNVVEVSSTTEGTIPLVSYFNMSVSARVISEQRFEASFFENLCRLACVLLMVPTEVAAGRLRAKTDYSVDREFMQRFLAACIRVVPTCLAYSIDKEGEHNTLPCSVPHFTEQQVDCEELALLCAILFRQLSRVSAPQGSLVDLLRRGICTHYDPMLCLVTTSMQSDSSSSKSRMAEEVDATHLVCVLWPNQKTLSPILLETMANVAPIPKMPARHDHQYLPPSLHPLYTQERFEKDRTYRDVIRVFRFDNYKGRYIENLVCRTSKRGVGAPFSELLNNSSSISFVPVHMSEDVAAATDLTSELTYPLGLQLDTSALKLSQKRADLCTEDLVTKRGCSHVFLFSADRRCIDTLSGKKAETLEKSIKAYMLEEIAVAEKNAAKMGEDSSYMIEGVTPMTPFYLLPGLYAYVVGLKFRRPLYRRGDASPPDAAASVTKTSS